MTSPEENHYQNSVVFPRKLTRATSSALLSTILLAVPAFSVELRLTVSGVRTDKGELLIALYDNAR